MTAQRTSHVSSASVHSRSAHFQPKHAEFRNTLQRHVKRLTHATLAVAFLTASTASSATAAEYFVSPSGSSSAPGTRTQPLDLATALSARSVAKPGDTIWVLGGRYVGPFVSYLSGTPNAPIVVRQFPGERATLESAGSNADLLTVYGQWTTFWGLELMGSDPGRLSTQSGPWPTDLRRGGGISAWGPNLKFINLVVHDLAAGMGVWKESVDTEVYGSLFYNNGWQGSDGSHGHGVYTQNATGQRRLRENIAFNQFSTGLHAYGSSVAFLNNITFEGNVAFNNGILGSSGFERDLLLGGGVLAQNPVFRQNFTYGGAQSNMGYGAGCVNGQAVDNYFMGNIPLLLVACTPVMTGNTLISEAAARWGWGALGFRPTDFPQNTYLSQLPTTNVIKVRANAYEPGRGHLIVYNWQRFASVDIDVSALGLAKGQTFEVRDAQNFYGPAIASGTFDGQPVRVAMTGLVLAEPVGTVPVRPQHTPIDFAVFVVLPTTGASTSAPPPVAAPPPAEPQPTAAAPSISPAGGSFTAPVAVTLATTTAGGAIRYTLDGSAPTSASAAYTGPITLSSSATVKAVTFASGATTSALTAAGFVITIPPPTVATPAIAPNGGTFTGQVSVTLSDATPGATIRYTTDGSVPTSNSSIYNGPLKIKTTSVVKAMAFATGATASSVVSASFTATATPPSASGGNVTAPRTAATFVRQDAQTAGNWAGRYGSEGTLIVGDDTRLPEAVKVQGTGNYTFISASSTTEQRALRRTLSAGRIAAVWFSPNGFSVDINLTDGRSHQLAIYLLDWINAGRVERVEVRDADTGALLDTRTASGFTNGVYLVWTVSGHLRLQFVVLGGSDAVMNGLFLDSTTTPVTPAPLPTAAAPTVSPNGGTFTGPVSVTLGTATAGATIRYSLDGTTPTSTSPAYTGPFSVSKTAVLRARTFANGFSDSAETSAAFTIVAPQSNGGSVPPATPGTGATFVKVDSTSQGSWKGVYGADGAMILGDGGTYPSYVQVKAVGPYPYTWASSTSDIRGLQTLSRPGRIASTWYSPNGFSVDLEFTDGREHQFAVYVLDWNNTGRMTRFDVRNASTGALLDSRTVKAFSAGQYLVWRVSGKVRIQLTPAGGSQPDAVMSGMFFDK